MNTATILGSHLNPQQAKLFSTPSGARKRWICSQQEDHLHLLAATAATDSLQGKPVVIWGAEIGVVRALGDEAGAAQARAARQAGGDLVR